MIVDISNIILYELRLRLPDVSITSSYPDKTPSFPLVIVEELDNTSDKATKDSSGIVYNNISYGIEIYTMGNARMTNAKRIRAIVDDILTNDFGLYRDFAKSIPNYSDTRVYRYKMIYNGKIDNNLKVYRR